MLGVKSFKLTFSIAVTQFLSTSAHSSIDLSVL